MALYGLLNRVRVAFDKTGDYLTKKYNEVLLAHGLADALSRQFVDTSPRNRLRRGIAYGLAASLIPTEAIVESYLGYNSAHAQEEGQGIRVLERMPNGQTFDNSTLAQWVTQAGTRYIDDVAGLDIGRHFGQPSGFRNYLLSRTGDSFVLQGPGLPYEGIDVKSRITGILETNPENAGAVPIKAKSVKTSITINNITYGINYLVVWDHRGNIHSIDLNTLRYVDNITDFLTRKFTGFPVEIVSRGADGIPGDDTLKVELENGLNIKYYWSTIKSELNAPGSFSPSQEVINLNDLLTIPGMNLFPYRGATAYSPGGGIESILGVRAAELPAYLVNEMRRVIAPLSDRLPSPGRTFGYVGTINILPKNSEGQIVDPNNPHNSEENNRLIGMINQSTRYTSVLTGRRFRIVTQDVFPRLVYRFGDQIIYPDNFSVRVPDGGGASTFFRMFRNNEAIDGAVVISPNARIENIGTHELFHVAVAYYGHGSRPSGSLMLPGGNVGLATSFEIQTGRGLTEVGHNVDLQANTRFRAKTEGETAPSGNQPEFTNLQHIHTIHTGSDREGSIRK